MKQSRGPAQALPESEQRFAGFMQHLPGLAWIKDIEGRYVYVNDAAEKAFRIPRHHLYGRTDEEIFPPETAARFRENDRLALSSPAGGIRVVETLEDEAGVLRHSLVSKFVIPGPDGSPAFVGGMAIDVTERRRLEEQKAELLALLDTLQQNAPVGFAFVDRDFRYVRINDALAAIDGRSAEEHIGKTVAESVPDLWPRLEPLYRTALEGGEAVTAYEVSGETPAAPGVQRHFLANYYPVRVNGEILGVGIIVQDITERKRMENELRERAERLAESDRLKDEFLAMLAHELRNPLAPIRNALYIMKQQGADGPAVAQVRDMAERQVQHMARLLDDLLDVSRISRGRIELRKEAVDVAAAIQRAAEAVRPLMEEKRHEFTVSLPAGPLPVEADPTRLEQVLTNLLNNAAKYTDPGGRVLISAERQPEEVVVHVADTGIGIAPDMLPRIFDLFVQAERRLDRARGGVGIGLTLARKLVELHGGRIDARSAGLGAGSEFVIRLPALTTSRRGDADWAAARQPPPPRRRVLVVDDNRDAADSLAMLLRLSNQEVRAAYDGPSALRTAEDFRPALVFLDIGMPGMDGHEVARRLRALPGLKTTRLVALTGWGQHEDRRRSADAGFDHHLVKPVDPKVLEDLLREGPA